MVEVNIIEKNQTTVSKKQRGGDCDQLEDVARVQNPVKIRVVFSANEFVIISNRDQETQTKPETSEEVLESANASSVAVLKFISTLHPVLYTKCNVCLCIFT